ncbi:MAG: hypothetical protein NVSMB12_05790 [Acidimicrobiales bacterium]
MSPSQAGVRVVGSGAPNPDDIDDGAPVDGGDAPTDRPERGRPSALMVALAVVALAGLVGTAVFWSKWHALDRHAGAQTAVTATATDFLKALTNFDASTIDADFNRVEGYAVGNFKTQAAQFFSSDVRKALAKVQAVSRGQIRDLYVESLKGDRASVYASVDQTIANINFKAPEQDELRIVVNMTKLPQGWRVSDVTVLQAPAVPTPGAAAPGATTPGATTGTTAPGAAPAPPAAPATTTP